MEDYYYNAEKKNIKNYGICKEMEMETETETEKRGKQNSS